MVASWLAAWPGRFNGIVGLPDCRQGGRLPGMRQAANRILIVDDSEQFRAAAELLAARGFELIEEADDGNEALSAIARACPDGILLDINLPGRDGLAVDWRSPSLSKMLVTCRSTAATVTTSSCAIRRWRAFGDQRKHAPLSRRQVVEGGLRDA